METMALLRWGLLLGVAIPLLFLFTMTDADTKLRGWHRWLHDGLKVVAFTNLAVLAAAVLSVIGGSFSWGNFWPTPVYFNGCALGAYTAVFLTGRWLGRRDVSFLGQQVADFGAIMVGTLAGYLLAEVLAKGVLSEHETTYVWEFDAPFAFIDQMMIGAALIVAFVAGTVRAFYAFRLYSERQARMRQAYQTLQLQEQQVSAQLQSLQARIQPHFLYNALNAIAAKIPTQPAQAEAMTLSLARLFRAALHHEGEPLATVREEIALVETYLDIERARFGDQLAVAIDVDEAVQDAAVPRFLLQPLVENAIKHGIAQQPDGGRVAVAVEPTEQGGVRLAVKDSGPDFPEDVMGGYGWQSVQQRLDLLFPDQYRIELENGADKQIRITLDPTA